MPHWRVVFVATKKTPWRSCATTEYKLSARLRAGLGAYEINTSLGLSITGTSVINSDAVAESRSISPASRDNIALFLFLAFG